MTGIYGPKPNGPRVSIDPQGRLAGGEPTGAPPKGHEPIKARIGRDAPEGSAPPPRPNSLVRDVVRPRLERQSAVTQLGASSVAPGAQAASKPRVTFNLDANTVRHFEIADGAHLNPTPAHPPSRGPSPRANALAAASVGAGTAKTGKSGSPVESGAPPRSPDELYGDWKFEAPKRGNFLSRLFTPQKAADDQK
jgi:hypothetical protein